VALTETVRLVVAAASSLVLAVAAFSDVRNRRIPNWTVLVLIGLSVVLMALGGGHSLGSTLAAAGLALATTVALYAFNIIGAGDSKLFTAVALFAGLGYLPLLVVATTLAGGLIALISIASRPQRALAMFTLRGKGDWGRGVPYGLAIALGGLIVMWAPQMNLVRPFGAPAPVSAKDISHAFMQPGPPK
jgi:prepilin peptidase CpaA